MEISDCEMEWNGEHENDWHQIKVSMQTNIEFVVSAVCKCMNSLEIMWSRRKLERKEREHCRANNET